MQQTIYDRIKFLIERNGLTSNAFAVKANIDASNMRKILKGELTLTARTIRKIAEAYGVQYEWLLNGEGEMAARLSDAGIPLLDGEQVAAGGIAGYGEPLLPIDTIRLPTVKPRGGDFAVRANGRSMIDPMRPELSIPDGALVVLRQWTESYIQWGEMYCIYTSSGYAIKRLQPGDDDTQIKCVSNNVSEGYEPYTISKDDIRGLAIVTNIIHVTTLHQ